MQGTPINSDPKLVPGPALAPCPHPDQVQRCPQAKSWDPPGQPPQWQKPGSSSLAQLNLKNKYINKLLSLKRQSTRSGLCSQTTGSNRSFGT